MASQKGDAAQLSRSAFYLRLKVADESGVLSEVTEVLKSHNMSIETLIQKQLPSGSSADLVMILHETTSEDITKASVALIAMSSVQDVSAALAVLS